MFFWTTSNASSIYDVKYDNKSSTNNVIEEISTNVRSVDAAKAPRHIHELLDAIKTDNRCHFRSRDRFAVVFFRIDSKYRIYQIRRNYNKLPTPLTDNIANSIKLEGYDSLFTVVENQTLHYWKPYTHQQQLQIDQASKNDGKQLLQ